MPRRRNPPLSNGDDPPLSNGDPPLSNGDPPHLGVHLLGLLHLGHAGHISSRFRNLHPHPHILNRMCNPLNRCQASTLRIFHDVI